MGPMGSLILGVLLILFLLLRLRLHPFLALILSALTCALVSDRIPVASAVQTVGLGFADLMGRVGILLVMAAIVGACLVESGAADKIIRSFARLFGEGREHYSFLTSSFILSMPVFFDTVFYLLAPLVRAAYARRKKDYTLMICAAAAGGAITHALVPPTPGPILVSETLAVPLGLTFVVGTVVSIVPAIVGGIFYARLLNRRLIITPRPMYGVTNEELEETASRPESELPSLAASLAPVLVPISLISSATVATLMLDEGSSLRRTILLMGNTDVAFILGASAAIFLVWSRGKSTIPQISETLEPAVTSGTSIAFITCAGGAFGKVLTDAGVGEMIAGAARDWGFSLLTLAFLTAALLRIAQGSATVAMVTTAGIVAPAVLSAEMAFHPVYLVAAIGFGATTTPWMNDSGFWIVGKMGGLTESETLKVWTALLTVIAITGFIWTWLLSTFVPLV